jgi:hypothetical protein
VTNELQVAKSLPHQITIKCEKLKAYEKMKTVYGLMMTMIYWDSMLQKIGTSTKLGSYTEFRKMHTAAYE